jgi:hypothetical protein
MTAKSETICSYTLADVRKSLWEAVDRRDIRAANRWTAELVATPGAVGSLWASYWLAWATSQSGPTIPILLKQSWASITAAAKELVPAGGWPAFRNDHDVRAIPAETTKRLLSLPRQTSVIWPSREIIMYDVANMRDSPVPAAADGPVVLRVWKRDEDALELRLMAGRFITHLETGDLRGALSALAWTLMTPAQQGLNAPLKCAERGLALVPSLSKKIYQSPLWFWLDLGRSYYLSKPHMHKGWLTMHNAIAEAFRVHYKRWTTVERMRILLAWILQVRASMTQQPDSIWTAPPLHQTVDEIDLPYKEIAAELADPDSVLRQKEKQEKQEEQNSKTRSEAKMAEADAAVMAALGLGTDDV